MRVLVTGGAGFIGSNLCRALVEQDFIDEVSVIDDLSTGFRHNLDGLDVRLVEGSILDERRLGDAALGADAVVHLAALGSVQRSVDDPLATHEVNATGTLRVLEQARAHDSHVLLASSSSVYGSNPVMPKSETLRCQPKSPYAVSKLAAESYADAFRQVYGLGVLPFRFFNVYGPRQRPDHVYSAVIPVFLAAALRGRPVPVHGDGHQSRDFTYVGTVVDVLCAALRERTVSEPTNLAFGTRLDLLTLIEKISSVTGARLDLQRSDARPGDVKHSSADNSLLRGLFPGLEPVGIDEGLAQTEQWMRDFLETSG